MFASLKATVDRFFSAELLGEDGRKDMIGATIVAVASITILVGVIVLIIVSGEGGDIDTPVRVGTALTVL